MLSDRGAKPIPSSERSWSPAAERQKRSIDFWPPTAILIASFASLVVAVHLGIVVWLSFVKGLPGQPDMVYTLQYYRELLFDPYTYTVLINTLIFAVTALAVAMILGLTLAWLLERTDMPGKVAVMTLMTIGLLIPGFSVALGWIFLFHSRVGIVNRLLMDVLGLTDAPINIATLYGMGMIEGVSLTPVVFVMASIVLKTMDASLEEAALTAGATPRETVARVTLPLIRPGIMAAGIYVLMIGFASFDIPAVIGLSQRIYTFSTFIFQQMDSDKEAPDFGDPATLSVMMVVVALALTWWYRTMLRQAPKYAVVTGRAYRPRRVALGRWRYPALFFVFCYFAVAQLLPALTLVWTSILPYLQPPSAQAFSQLTLANYLALGPDVILPALKNTAVLMVVVPTITLIASFAISWSVLRTQSKLAVIFDFFAFLPHAIPNIIFGVAAWLLTLFVLRKFVPIYGTIWILLLVYIVVRLSYGTRMLNSALIQIHKDLEDSATMSGAKTSEVVAAILLPLLWQPLVYSWIWIAMLAYRELTLAVLLASSESRPLSVVVWGMISNASYGQASSVCVIMLVLMAPLVLAYWAFSRRGAPNL